MIGRMNENATLFITDLPNHPAAAAVKRAPGGAPEFFWQFIWIIINMFSFWYFSVISTTGVRLFIARKSKSIQ